MPDDGLVRVVVDDTACLVPEVADNLDIAVVPLNLTTDDDGVSTSAVSPLQLCAVYARALERSCKDGHDAGVVALHVSKEMSSTWSNAVSAVSVLQRVTVIDSQTVGAGVGAAAIAAAKAARRGASRDEVAEVAREFLQRYRLWLFVPKLDSLRRGGRIPTGQAMLSTALAIKPIVGIKDGALSVVAKCRTEAKVKQRMVEFAAKVVQSARSATRPPAVLLHHADALDDVQELRDMLAHELPDDTRFKILELPDSLVAHVGPGAYAVGLVSGGSIEHDDIDFYAEMGATQLMHAAGGTRRVPHPEETIGQATPLLTTMVSKLPTWSENRRAALEKANQLAKAIADLSLRDKSDPEGAAFGDSEVPGDESPESKKDSVNNADVGGAGAPSSDTKPKK